MGDILLIATDMDGTFLARDHMPSSLTLEAVRAVQHKGIRVCACSGRNHTELKDICEFAGLDEMAVINNGASIVNYRTKEYLIQRRIEPDQVGNIMSALLLDSKDYPGTTLSLAGGFQTHVWRGCCGERTLSRLGADNKSGYSAELFFVHDSYEEWIEASKNDIQVIRYSLDSVVHGERIKKLLEPYCEVEIYTAFPGRMEISPKGSGKGNCLQHLVDYYGFAVENLMAIGDGPNDADMMLAAGLGVAMGNSVQAVLNAADAVTDTCENEGFCKALYRYALEQDQEIG